MIESTAIYPNRQLDRRELWAYFRLSEIGNEGTEFWIGDGLFARGYVRIVYGDHGPYIEFERNNILMKLVSKFGNKIYFDNIPENPKYYYYWLKPESRNIKVYFQLKTVEDLPNAPRRTDGRPSKFNREEGYADYKIGKFYVDPYEFGRKEIIIP